MIEAVCTLFMVYYVLDVQYASELSKTVHFLDACVGRVDKFLKVRPFLCSAQVEHSYG